MGCGHARTFIAAGSRRGKPWHFLFCADCLCHLQSVAGCVPPEWEAKA